MIRYARITEFDVPSQTGRVQFPDDEIVTDWLPIITAGSKGEKHTRTLATNELVVVWIDEHAEDGVILGSIYDETNTPPDNEQAGVTFADGGSIKWDTSGKLIVTKSTTIVEIGASGVTIEKGGDSLADALGALIDAIKLITVTCASPGSPSTTPINFAAFDAVAVRLNNILD